MYDGNDEVFVSEWYPREIYRVVNSVNHFWILGNKEKKLINHIDKK